MDRPDMKLLAAFHNFEKAPYKSFKYRAPCFGRLASGERDRGTHRIQIWAGTRTSLDALD